jgi:hypothetical protein
MFQFKKRIVATLKSAAFGAAAAAIGLVAFSFFFAAAFVWTSDNYGAINACLAAGGFFMVVALIAVAASVVMKRRAERLAAAQALWTHPKVLAAGVQATGLLGGKRQSAAASMLLAFAVGFLLTQNASKK